MKVYLVARYGRRTEMESVRNALLDAGHAVTSRWITGVHGADDGDQARWSEFAHDDLADIIAANALLVFSEAGAFPRGSRHVELGMGLAFEKLVYVVGPMENIFMALPVVQRFDTLDECISAMSEDDLGD